MAAHQRKTGLGRGLGALLNDSVEVPAKSNQQVEEAPLVTPTAVTATKENGSISHVRVEEISVNPFQPRTEFNRLLYRSYRNPLVYRG